MKKRLRFTTLGKVVMGALLALVITGTVGVVTKEESKALEVKQEVKLVEPIRDGLSYDPVYREQYLQELETKQTDTE